MLINPSSLITGALSYTIAISWNKAAYETLVKIAGENKYSAILHAILVTMLIIVIFIILNSIFMIFGSKSLLKVPKINKNLNFKIDKSI